MRLAIAALPPPPSPNPRRANPSRILHEFRNARMAFHGKRTSFQSEFYIHVKLFRYFLYLTFPFFSFFFFPFPPSFFYFERVLRKKSHFFAGMVTFLSVRRGCTTQWARRTTEYVYGVSSSRVERTTNDNFKKRKKRKNSLGPSLNRTSISGNNLFSTIHF